MENLHDELTPEQSAAVLAAHIPNGIDLAYQYKLPKPLISFIPQHHGTAQMGYFYAKARDEAIAAAGAIPGTPGGRRGGEVGRRSGGSATPGPSRSRARRPS